MDERTNITMDKTTAIQAETTLVLSEHTEVRCLLIKERCELHVTVLIGEIERLKRHLMTATDETSGALMDRIIHLKRLVEGMRRDIGTFEVRAHWYVAVDVCAYLGQRCHKDFLETFLKPDGMRMERVLCSDGKRHLAYLVSGNALWHMAEASPRKEARRFCSVILNHYPSLVSLEAPEDSGPAEDKTITVLTKALEKKTAENKALHRKLATRDVEIGRLKRWAGLFEDIRGFVERSA